MDAADLVGLAIAATFLFMLAVEKLFPARQFPARRGWTWLGMAFLLLVGMLSTVVPLVVDERWLHVHRWIDGSGLGVAGGTVLGYVVLSGAGYVWHRTLHTVPLLWRLTHQLHHSPQRVDMPGSVLFLGYVIQRPQAHCEHHRLGVHAFNYGDLPIWDLLLGTFRNPDRFAGHCGFEAPLDRKLGTMLAFGDVNRPLYGPGSRGAAAPPFQP